MQTNKPVVNVAGITLSLYHPLYVKGLYAFLSGYPSWMIREVSESTLQILLNNGHARDTPTQSKRILN